DKSIAGAEHISQRQLRTEIIVPPAEVDDALMHVGQVQPHRIWRPLIARADQGCAGPPLIDRPANEGHHPPPPGSSLRVYGSPSGRSAVRTITLSSIVRLARTPAGHRIQPRHKHRKPSLNPVRLGTPLPEHRDAGCSGS